MSQPPLPLPLVILTSREVAEHLHVHPITVARWVASGHITPLRNIPNAGYVFTHEEVERVRLTGGPHRGRPSKVA